MWQLPPDIKPEDILDYLRKSRADDPLLSVSEVLAKHEQMLDEWVERNLPGMGRVPEKNRLREVVSGETIESRPMMQELIRRIGSPDVKAVLCVEPQRLSRGDLEDIGRLVKLLRYSNTLVITMQYTYDLRDERDRDMFERELKRGNEFLEYQKKILNNGRLLSVRNGNYIARHAPYGYKKVKNVDVKPKCYTLEPVPDEAEAVKIIFAMYKNGYGAARICNQLEEMGYRPRNGGHWADATIHGILKNVHYIGKVRWNYKPTVKVVEDGEIVARRSISDDYLVFPGKHPAIIDQETWDAVQARFGSTPRTNKGYKLTNPLAGLLFCACGASMKRQPCVKDGVEIALPRYVCRQAKHCEHASCTTAELISDLKKELVRAIEDFEVRVESGEEGNIEAHRQLIEQLEQRMERLNAKELAQWDKYTQEDMPKNVFDKLNERLLAEKEEVQQALCVAKDNMPEPIDFEERVSTFRACVELLEKPDAPVEELNAMLKDCIERITYKRPKVQGRQLNWGTGGPFEIDIDFRL